METSQRFIMEGYAPWLLDPLVQPHTLGRAFYMRPTVRPQIADKEYNSNSQFWHDVLNERITAERNVRLPAFNVFDWVPRNPGLYHTYIAEEARREAQNHVQAIDPTVYNEYLNYDGAPPDAASLLRKLTSGNVTAPPIIFTPHGKLSMLNGGVGCVRFKSLNLKSGGTAWLVSATSTSAPDEGIPLLMANDDYEHLYEDMITAGSVCCDIIGRTRFVADEFRDLFSVQNGIPRLYVEVLRVDPRRMIVEPGQISVAASFLSSFEGGPKIYASYVTFDPARSGARVEAAQWMKEDYVERLYKGIMLTDFDQRAPMFADALFTLDHVMTSPDLADKVSKLAKLYGSFDWAQLDRFSYVEHQGDLIVTNNTITVSNSTNVVIQSTLTNAQLTAGTMPTGNEAQKKELQALLKQLGDALPKTAFDKEDDAAAVAEQAKDVVNEAAKPQPNKTRLRVLGQGLKTAAEFLTDTVPSAVTIAGQIVNLVGHIHGISQ